MKRRDLLKGLLLSPFAATLGKTETPSSPTKAANCSACDGKGYIHRVTENGAGKYTGSWNDIETPSTTVWRETCPACT